MACLTGVCSMALTITKGIIQYPSDRHVRLASQQYIRTMITVAEVSIRKHAPKDTGQMAEWLATPTSMTATARGHKASMGYIPPLRINRTAPRNTIKRFLQWYRYARLSKKKANSGNNSWTTAWYYLDQMERSALRGARYGAQFGGPHPPPTYTEAVNAGKVPLPAGTAAYAKAVRNRGFIERIRQDVENKHIIAVNETLRTIRG